MSIVVYVAVSEDYYGGADSTEKCKKCGTPAFRIQAFRTLEAAENRVKEYSSALEANCPSGSACRVNLDVAIVPLTVSYTSSVPSVVYAAVSEDYYGGADSTDICKPCGTPVFQMRAFEKLEAAEKCAEEYGSKTKKCPEGPFCRSELDVAIVPLTVN